MDKTTARLLGEKVFDLIVLCAEYDAKFRRGVPSHGSSEEQWKQWQKIFDQQRLIAGMLDNDALTATKVSLAGWRLFSDAMDTGLAVEVIKAVGNLIIFCVKAEQEQNKDLQQTMVINQQHVISRMLDPKAIRERII